MGFKGKKKKTEYISNFGKVALHFAMYLEKLDYSSLANIFS